MKTAGRLRVARTCRLLKRFVNPSVRTRLARHRRPFASLEIVPAGRVPSVFPRARVARSAAPVRVCTGRPVVFSIRFRHKLDKVDTAPVNRPAGRRMGGHTRDVRNRLCRYSRAGLKTNSGRSKFFGSKRPRQSKNYAGKIGADDFRPKQF